ncbi:MAG: hypothetical protein HY262_03985 [Chloroflexi bacterium]|nr:hypothetical protein [Chloroflexota bacterium]
MSPDADRIAVPTNGKRPHPAPEPAAPVPVAPASPPPATVTGPFTPTQLAVGFGILAAALALLAGSLRRRSRAGRPGRFGRR